MSGFIRSLVARAEGLLPVLERRPRALFETAPGSPPLADEVSRPEMVTPSAARAASDEADEPRMAPRPGERQPVTTIHAAPRVTPDQFEADVRTPMQALPRQSSSRPVPSAATAPPVAVEAHALEAPPARPSVFLPAAPDEARMVHTGTLPSFQARVRRVPPDSGNVDAETAPEAWPSGFHDVPSVGALLPQPVQSARPVMLLARQQTKPTSRRDVAMNTAPAALPPVQISIGRIEIRATANASADRPRAVGPTAPRLSLDDYLRCRDGASR